MNRSLISLAVLAACCGAHAQSSVTLFGVVDASFSSGRGSVSNVTGLRSSGLTNSAIGVRGVEDLGGGLKAGFWLEADVQADNGAGLTTNTNNQVTGNATCAVTTATTTTTVATPAVAGTSLASTSTSTSACTVAPNGAQGLTFSRRSVVTFGGSWGQLILGRDYNTMFWNNAVFDPFGVNGVGTSQAFLSRFAGGGPTTSATGPFMNGGSALYVRASNSVAYAYGFAPNGQTAVGHGFYAHAMYFMGENPSNSTTRENGNGYGLRVGYNGGPVNVAASYTKAEFATTPAASITPATFGSVTLGDVKEWSVAGSYDFGFVKPRVMYVHDEFGTRSGRGWLAGATAPVGPGEAKLAYSTYKTSLGAGSAKWALGYVHHLSKRTALYATYARVSNKGGAAQSVNGSATAANAGSSGYDIGIRHVF